MRIKHGEDLKITHVQHLLGLRFYLDLKRQQNRFGGVEKKIT